MKSPTTTNTGAKRPITEIEFCAWVAQAVPGDRMQYHRGFLAHDAFPMRAEIANKDRTELRKLADRSFWAAEVGLVHLVQQRIDTDLFAYIAIARPKPKHVAVSLSKLLLEGEAA
jgi:hypothetical protein